MNVGELIEKLNRIEDKNLPIRIINIVNEDEENIWVFNVEVSNTLDSGYEDEGEVRILGSE